MFSIYLKNGFRFGAKIDFKNEEIKIAYQILNQILKKYHSQFWFKLFCLLLHFQEEAALEGIL